MNTLKCLSAVPRTMEKSALDPRVLLKLMRGTAREAKPMLSRVGNEFGVPAEALSGARGNLANIIREYRNKNRATHGTPGQSALDNELVQLFGKKSQGQVRRSMDALRELHGQAGGATPLGLPAPKPLGLPAPGQGTGKAPKQNIREVGAQPAQGPELPFEGKLPANVGPAMPADRADKLKQMRSKLPQAAAPSAAAAPAAAAAEPKGMEKFLPLLQKHKLPIATGGALAAGGLGGHYLGYNAGAEDAAPVAWQQGLSAGVGSANRASQQSGFLNRLFGDAGRGLATQYAQQLAGPQMTQNVVNQILAGL